MLKKIAMVVLAASLASPVLAAQDNWLAKAQEINRKSIAERDAAAKQVFFKSGETAEKRVVSLPVKLQAGKFYGFMADCDYECDEAVLSLTQNGKEVAGFQREAGNSSPMFGYRAAKSGSYVLNYTITECSKEKCAYSAQVFEGNKEYELDF